MSLQTSPTQILIKMGDAIHDAVYPHEPTLTERIQEVVSDVVGLPQV